MVRKIQFREDNSPIALYSFRKKTIIQIMTKTTTVRMAVAKFEFTFSTPTLAKIAVSAAKKAESKA